MLKISSGVRISVLSVIVLFGSSTLYGGIQTNTIAPSAALIGDGHVVVGTVFLGCTAGQLVHFTLTLTQDGVSATGLGAGVCTGSLTAYEVTVPAGSDTFTAGLATACATAVNYRRGVIVDTRQWCRAAGVVLFAA